MNMKQGDNWDKNALCVADILSFNSLVSDKLIFEYGCDVNNIASIPEAVHVSGHNGSHFLPRLGQKIASLPDICQTIWDLDMIYVCIPP